MEAKKNLSRLLTLAIFYAAILLLFEADRLCFLGFQGSGQGLDFDDFVQTWQHGLALDLASAGYITAPLWFLLGVDLWTKIPKLLYIYRFYTGVVAVVLALVFVADISLYGFWGIRLDGTIWNYIDSPKGIAASVSGGYITAMVVLIAVVATAIYLALNFWFPGHFEKCKKRLLSSGLWLLIGGLLFLGIRGGVGKSTANVGMVYYSDNQFRNHAAVNPAFSIFYSLKKTRNFADQFNFYSEEERAELFASLSYSTESLRSDTLLTTRRPNVLIILMEGCGGTFVHAVDSLADPGVTPNLNRLANEGIVFTQCFANSFRTDRGTLCTLSGYPSFPDASVMKMPAKYGKLPSIAGSLRKAGYSTQFLYGGDINFTNTNGYLLATGYEKTFGDTSFPTSVRHTHDWGVTDHIAFDSLFARIQRLPEKQPWHVGFLTLASHEPWKVPYSRIENDEVANAMAYLDDCIGNFIEKFRQTPQWATSLVILLPDHGIAYPVGLPEVDERRSHIPMIWTGGAVREPREVNLICNQTDLPATLLGQLGLSHKEFPFSRDVLSQTYTHPSAIHTWSEGIYYLDNSGISVLNLLAKPVKELREEPAPSAFRTSAAKAFIQTAYDHLGEL